MESKKQSRELHLIETSEIWKKIDLTNVATPFVCSQCTVKKPETAVYELKDPKTACSSVFCKSCIMVVGKPKEYFLTTIVDLGGEVVYVHPRTTMDEIQ